jgi:hypothetical protein
MSEQSEQRIIVDSIEVTFRCSKCGVRTHVGGSRFFTSGDLFVVEGQADWYCACGGAHQQKVQALVSIDPDKTPAVSVSPCRLTPESP